MEKAIWSGAHTRPWRQPRMRGRNIPSKRARNGEADTPMPPRLAGALAELVKGDAVCDEVASRLIILSNGLMSFFAQNACEVSQHVRIDDETATAAHGALFNQENVPAETLFYAVINLFKGRGQNVQRQNAGSGCHPSISKVGMPLGRDERIAARGAKRLDVPVWWRCQHWLGVLHCQCRSSSEVMGKYAMKNLEQIRAGHAALAFWKRSAHDKLHQARIAETKRDQQTAARRRREVDDAYGGRSGGRCCFLVCLP